MKIDISLLALLKIVGVVLALWFFYAIKGVVAILFVAVILASAVDPIVSWLVRKKIPRLLSIIIIYIILLSFVSLVIVLLLPPVTTQIQNLTSDFPHYWQRFSKSFSALQSYGTAASVQNALSQLSQFLARSGQGVFETLFSVFGGIFSFIVILVITFYLLLEENAIKKILRLVSPARYQPYFTRLLYKMRDKIGLWLRGQIVLSFIIALIVFVGLSLFGLVNPLFAKYALTLALLAFLLEFIPYLGPIISAVPGIFIGFTQSLSLAAMVLAFYVVIQWLENNLIVPRVMKWAVGLNPIVVIIALMIGARVGGVVGLVLAIPVATALSVLLEEVMKELERKEIED